ncbi:MAG TPA: NAD-dependent epimerase/dehydratase family protein, partial [Solirubrobacteraceae bacterium]|nr:NAD-dependent epimerase/dehydratase family protein [Solirubrobacteraceae bacterium]
MARVFVAGGSGLLGAALVRALLERGDTVVALARSEASADALAASGAEVRRGEITDVRALRQAMEGCELAFNLAGVNGFCMRGEDALAMRRANVDGAVAAVRAAHEAGVRRLVHTSSAATIGEAPGVIADEWTAHRGWYLSLYEQTKTLGERAALASATALGQELVLV